MFENLGHFFKKMVKPETTKELGSKDAAKERLHLVLMQDRANVSADFLELMKQEIIDVIKKYIVVDEESIDVRLTNQSNDDGTNGAPALYANIPIVNIKNDMMAEKVKEFEGVDFNKEMGLLTPEEKEKMKNEQSTNVINLQENYPEKPVEEVIEENNVEDVSIPNADENIEKSEDNSKENMDKTEENSNFQNEEKSTEENTSTEDLESEENSTKIIINENIEEENKDEEKEIKFDEDEEESLLESESSNIDYSDEDEDEDDDDVTFDDLLKAAEAEDEAQNQDEKTKTEKKSKQKKQEK